MLGLLMEAYLILRQSDSRPWIDGQMPNPEAQAAYAEAQQILKPLQDVHDRESELLRKFESTTDPLVANAIHAQIDVSRTKWTDLCNQYTDAIARYTVAVQVAGAPRDRIG
jgi:hypothetical protein